MRTRRPRALSMLALCVGVALPPDPIPLRNDVQALLRAGTHVSVVLGAGETFDTASAGTPGEAGRDANEAFGARWGRLFEVSSEPSRVSVRSRQAPVCDASLARRIAIQADGTPVELLFAIAKAADPSLAALGPPGLLSGGPVAPDSKPMPTQRITFSGKAVPIGRALDLMTQPVEGLGWWAEERCASSAVCACRIGLLTSDSVVFTSYDIAAKAMPDPAR